MLALPLFFILSSSSSSSSVSSAVTTFAACGFSQEVHRFLIMPYLRRFTIRGIGGFRVPPPPPPPVRQLLRGRLSDPEDS
jgi:hypothetical protein